MEKYFTEITQSDIRKEWTEWLNNTQIHFIEAQYALIDPEGRLGFRDYFNFYRKGILELLLGEKDIEQLENLFRAKSDKLIQANRVYLQAKQQVSTSCPPRWWSSPGPRTNKEEYRLEKKSHSLTSECIHAPLLKGGTLENGSLVPDDMNQITLEYQRGGKLRIVQIQFFNMPDEWFWMKKVVYDSSGKKTTYYKCDGFYGFKKLVELELAEIT